MGKIKRLIADRRGNVAILGALTLPIFIGGIAFGTEAGHWFVEKSKLSFVTDAAAVSAGELYNRGISSNGIYNAIHQDLIADGYPASTLVLNITYPTSTSDLMTVKTSYRADKFFSQVIWDGEVDIAARTVVAIQGKQACILALNTSIYGAVTMSGSSTATLTGCVIASNSTSSGSIYLGGSTTVTTDCMVASGGIDGESSATTVCDRNRKYRRETDDPFASLVQPNTPGWCYGNMNFKPGNTYTLDPGCYTKDLSLKGTVTFNSGVYILDGANLKINSGAVVKGTDVTFVLKNGAELDFNGGATIQLTAPEAGSGKDYEGILFWGSKTNSASQKINGNADSYFAGAIYFPDDAVEFTGNSGLDSSCARIIGDTITLIGNTSFSTDCTTYTGPYQISTADSVVIVE